MSPLRSSRLVRENKSSHDHRGCGRKGSIGPFLTRTRLRTQANAPVCTRRSPRNLQNAQTDQENLDTGRHSVRALHFVSVLCTQCTQMLQWRLALFEGYPLPRFRPSGSSQVTEIQYAGRPVECGRLLMSAISISLFSHSNPLHHLCLRLFQVLDSFG